MNASLGADGHRDRHREVSVNSAEPAQHFSRAYAVVSVFKGELSSFLGRILSSVIRG